MVLFEYILILLAAICLSNLIHRFIPVLSVPIVQITLGALLTLLPLGFRMELDPDLFFVLFVAPLVYWVSMKIDKKTMWAQRKPILSLSILLVIATVVAVGYLVNLLIPAIPLAAAFALIAALGPTDDVAVASVSKRVNVPPKIMTILQGESIVNDASGIVSFQFALAAMLTGSFSIVQATGRFVVVALGGIAIGLALVWIKQLFVRWIRSLGMENVTLHLLLELLTPFVVYLTAEAMGVSGILAIFAAGVAYSFNRDKFSPERVNLHIASESIWSMLTFTLEGLVFVILGTQLPKILSSIGGSGATFSITGWAVLAYILLLTFVFLLTRFLWSVFAITKRSYQEAEHPISRFRAGIIFSLSGARGAVTLASVMSIPILMSDKTAFPERDLIILIASGVIVVSLLITGFILPLCVEESVKKDKSAENQAHIEILHTVIAALKKNITTENEARISIVADNYFNRINDLQSKQISRFPFDRKEERKHRIALCEWEREKVMEMLELGETEVVTAQYYLKFLDRRMERLQKRGISFVKWKRMVHFLHRSHRRIGSKERAELRTKVFALIETVSNHILEKLRKMGEAENNPAIHKITTEYEFRMVMRRGGLRQGEIDAESLASIVSTAFQTERDAIQAMLEEGRISRETAKEMRHNISLLEVQLKKEFL